ncbi:MAG TPA: FG-GAP-like repeat-containing protein [Ignavibacteria bacterium]|nr:FG-GAP-like repeat-containing protein [Ignavibacteria bacterium]HRJ99405.1 FG-GAP-like repeat-containing protein [Ignavibacteria bacterium]
MNIKSAFFVIVILFMITRFLTAQSEFEREPEYQTDATSLQSINGLVASQRFGYSVSNCGDINGDGYDDIISGAHFTNSSAGRAYIYLGGPNMSTTPSFVLNGEAANNFFGISVSEAGDVNGDGYADVIVGAYGYSSGIGRAYIYYGGYNMDNIADVVLTGTGNINFGYSVSSAGDVNGDGFSDVIVSGHAYSTNRGRAYIYYGGLMMDNIPDKILEGVVAGGFFGFSLTGTGDVNGDGFSDVLVGAYAVSSSTGNAYLFYGGTNMDTVADVTFSGETTNSFFGQSTSDAGDVNGDGYSDLLIAAPNYSTVRGRAYIYYGGPVTDNIADVVFTGELTGIQFGRVSGVGDINGDGFSDILIGAQGYQSLKGRAYLFYGGTAMNNVADMIMTGEATSNSFGWAVGGGGDINGDGYKDFIVGAFGNNSNRGKIYIYKNSLTGNDIPDVITYGEFVQNLLGASLSDAGDLNGDGFDDYIVGAPSYGDFARGRAYIHFGSVNPDTIPDLIINGFDDNSWFGTAVSGIGDVNADGYDDIAIGAPEYNSQQGRVYIYYGGATMDTVHDLRMSGLTTNSRFGHAISAAGDMNGDGYSDIVIGSPNYQSLRGRFSIYYGGSPMDTISDFGISGAATNYNLGLSVSLAGDLNSDGYSDILVGSPFYDTTGAVYVILGYSFSLRVITGENDYDFFGLSVSGAGDVNGDGYDDFIIGAPYANENKGKAYLYFGGLDLDYNHDVEYTGFNSEFGYSVSDAGDVNNDGFDDVLIGERKFEINKGRSYIYFGGYSVDNYYDILLYRNQYDENFGSCVSNAGDINGDGVEDVLIGGPGNIFNGGGSGAAYLYLSSPPSVKPILISVKDVPNDQGGKVNLKWTRSAYDVVGTDMITDYLIQRSLPPGTGGFFWENIANIPATREPYYAFNDNTPFDSLSGNSGTLYYRITARTNNQNNFWRSNIVYGRSIDNIAPLMVLPFTAAPVMSNVVLNWKRSDASDLLNYILYRSISQTIDPETEPIFATTTDSAYLDTSPLSGLYYYFIVAQDIHNNKSPVAVAESPNMTLNLTMFIEGFYNAASNEQVSDSVIVELRNATSPFAVADVSKVVVESNGSGIFKFGTADNGNYYLAIKHRNSIETWSNTVITLSRNSPTNFNLSTSSSQAFGNNLILVDNSPVRFSIYSGDVNQDGVVDLTDGSFIDNDAYNFNSGYLSTDVNGDGIVDVTDAVYVDNNATGFVGVIKP